jgi:hypothetical protein
MEEAEEEGEADTVALHLRLAVPLLSISSDQETLPPKSKAIARAKHS